MRIAILTFHRAYNCGAMLQAWALKTVLERMGHTVEFPCGKYNEVGYHPPTLPMLGRNRSGSLVRRIRSFAYRLALTLVGKKDGITAGIYYDDFRKKYLPERECEVVEFGKYFDAIILGSDQVLNPHLNEWTSYFLCRDIPKGINKVAYAVSVGERQLTMEDRSLVQDALSSFSAVSMREQFMGYAVTLDPTLLLEPCYYDPVVKYHRCSGKYIYMYSCEASDFEVEIARQIATRLGLGLIITPTHGVYNRGRSNGFSNLISPSFMVGYIRGAEFVLAGSFHGTAVSLLHGKQFLNIVPDDRPTKRVSALLELVGEQDRIVNPRISIDEMIVRLRRPLGGDCFARLAKARDASIKWLRDAVAMPMR